MTKGKIMKKWYAEMTCGAGMQSAELVEALTEDSADAIARELCMELASSYGYYQDLDLFGDLDQLYQEDSWDEDDEEYMEISSMEYFVEEYNPEEHDGSLY